MAFIPDNAEDRFHELSPSAERFYIYLCKTRNHKMQVSFGTIDACAARYEWKRATKFAVIKELTSKGWIRSDGHAWHILVGDFSPVNKSKNLDSQSENLDCESKKSDYQSKNLDSHIRNIPALPEIEPEEIYIPCEDVPPVNAGFVDDDFAEQVENIFIWLRQRKNLKRLPQSEWLALFTDLEAEDITLDKFKEFYLWVENLDWVTGVVTIKLLRGQIEAFKNREHFEAKKIIKQGTNGNGKIQPSNGKYQNPKLAKDEYALRELELSERNRAEVERELDALREKDGNDR